MRILLVTQMWPGQEEPDLGAFVAQTATELERQGHELVLAAIDRRGGSRAKYARLCADAVAAALSSRPEVIYAHFLFPAGAIGALASLAGRAPLVLTAHGRDVRNIGAIPGVRLATRLACRRAASVVAVSHYLRRELEAKLPELAARLEVVDSGVDLERFRGRDAAEARERLGWAGEGPFFLFIGALDKRKNVERLLAAFERLGEGRLAMVGDGPLRAELQGRPRLTIVGRVAHERVPDWIAACDVLCQPSLVEPFGQALLEAMAAERSVVATRVGGPPEFVTSEAGVLVDPWSVDSILEGMRAAARLPAPNRAARQAAAEHDVRRQTERIAGLLAAAARR